MVNAPNWPDPPFFPSAFVENPWTLVVLLLTAAFVFGLVARRRGTRGPMRVAAVCLLLAAVLPLTDWLVETDRERLGARTRELIDAATAPVDLDRFGELLADDARLFGLDREGILGALKRSAQQWGVTQSFITRLRARTTSEKSGETFIVVLTHSASVGGTSKTSWIFHWRKEADGAWRIRAIEWISLNDNPSNPALMP